MTLTNAQRLTLVITAIVTAALLTWDYILLRDGIKGNTISAAFKAASSCIPIPLTFGIWMGHMWFNRSGVEDFAYPWLRIVAFAALVIGSWLWWEGSNDRARLWLSAHPSVVFPMGYVTGYWVWPQFMGTLGS